MQTFPSIYEAVKSHGFFHYLMDYLSLTLNIPASQIWLARVPQAGFFVLLTHPYDSLSCLFYEARCPKLTLCFQCLLISAYQWWCCCWECLGLCSPGPFLYTAAPTDIFPIRAHAVAGLVLVVLDFDHQGALRWQSLLCTCPGGYKAYLGHIARS